MPWPNREASADPFTIAVAGLRISIRCHHSPTQQQLRGHYAPWLSDAPARCAVSVTCGSGPVPTRRPSPVAAFEADGRCLVTAPGYQGLIDGTVRSAALSIEAPLALDVDYFLRAVLALLAFEQGGMLVHGAGILRGGRAFLFSGRSGVGKSTTVRVSAGLPGVVPLSDDLVLLLPDGQGWRAFGTPFWNPEAPWSLRTGQTRSGPLAAVFRLVQDSDVFVRPMSASEAVAGLLSDLPVVPLDPRRTPVILARLSNLAANVPLAELHFRPEPSLWSAVDVFLAENFRQKPA